MLRNVIAAAFVFVWPLTAETAVPDVEVTDQNGRLLHFYRDLVQGRVVAVDFIFTSCQTICTVLGANFAKVDQLLAERAGTNTVLISISVDPVNDTPAKLQAYAARYGKSRRWTLVTGEKSNIEKLLRAFGEYSPDKTAHTPTVLIGRGDGKWTRANGLGSPKIIADLLAAVP